MFKDQTITKIKKIFEKCQARYDDSRWLPANANNLVITHILNVYSPVHMTSPSTQLFSLGAILLNLWVYVNEITNRQLVVYITVLWYKVKQYLRNHILLYYLSIREKKDYSVVLIRITL